VGLIKLFSDGKYEPPNPNPKNFKLIHAQCAEDKRTIWVCEVYYPGCTTLDGRKILVYECEFDAFLAFLRGKEMDPHFLDPWDKRLGPIARFPATEEGIDDALHFADWKSRQDRVL
jgi:hypothetical protein